MAEEYEPKRKEIEELKDEDFGPISDYYLPDVQSYFESSSTQAIELANDGFALVESSLDKARFRGLNI